MTEFPNDVWASGQMGSKLWLCQEAEKVFKSTELNVVILAGWCGLLGQLMFSRDRLNIKSLKTIDADESTVPLAEKLLGLWIWQKRASVGAMDINKTDFIEAAEIVEPNQMLIVNTSLEHFDSNEWWSKIPNGTNVILQGTNMQHHEHIHLYHSEKQIESEFKLKNVFFSGRLNFDYASDKSFSRYMVIGEK
jgi:hypothetical protein